MANAFTLNGNVVAEPELKFLNDGTAVASFRVASNSSRKQGEEWVEEGTLWVSVSAFGKLAEQAANTLQKGIRVIVQGPLKNREWEDKDGNKRDSIEMRADLIGVDINRQNIQVSKQSNNGNDGGNYRPGNNSNRREMVENIPF